MKKLIALSLVFASIAGSVTAQETPKMKQEHEMKDQHHEGNMMKMKDLNITDAQKTQMKAIREDFKKQMDLLKQNQNMSMKEFNDRKEALQKDQKAKMEALLTPEQKEKMAQQKIQFEADRKTMLEKQMAEMKTKLSLTDDQVKKLNAQHEALEIKMKAIREDQSLNQESRKEKMTTLRKQSEEERNKVLTSEQLKKLEELRKDRNDDNLKQPQQ